MLAGGDDDSASTTHDHADAGGNRRHRSDRPGAVQPEPASRSAIVVVDGKPRRRSQAARLQAAATGSSSSSRRTSPTRSTCTATTSRRTCRPAARCASASRPSIEGVFEVELEGRKRADRRAEGLARDAQTAGPPRSSRRWRSAALARPGAGGRPRARRPRRPADPGVAVRLGGGRRADRLLRRRSPLLWQDARSSRATRRFRPLPEGLSFALINPATEVFAGPGRRRRCSASRSGPGSPGVQSPQANFAPTFIYVIFWVGPGAGSASSSETCSAPSTRGARSPAAPAGIATRVVRADAGAVHLSRRLGRWPAAVGPARLRLDGACLHATATTRARWRSRRSSTARSPCSAIACFGTETWISRGEAFSVYFNLFSRISPLEVRDGRLGLRPPLSGAHPARRRARDRSRCCS